MENLSAYKIKCYSKDNSHNKVYEDIFVAENKDIKDIVKNFCQICAKDYFEKHPEVKEKYLTINNFQETYTYSLTPISKQEYVNTILGGIYNVIVNSIEP